MAIDKELAQELKQIIIERLNLRNVKPEQINDQAAIFGESEDGFGLDSIDALELVTAFSTKYDVEITDEDMNIFESVETMTNFIQKNRKK